MIDLLSPIRRFDHGPKSCVTPSFHCIESQRDETNMEVVVPVLLFLFGGTILKSSSRVHTTFGQYALDPLCFALALWNGRGPILKERLF
jgi:hypothetical protein